MNHPIRYTHIFATVSWLCKAVIGILFGISYLSISISIAIAGEQFAPGPSKPVPELFQKEKPVTTDVLVNESREALDKIKIADGLVVFVQHHDGSVGVVFEGLLTLRVINILSTMYHATPLEVFTVIAPQGRTLPPALVIDHEARINQGKRPSVHPMPTLDELVTRAAVHGNTAGPIPGNAICNDNWFPNWEFFTHPDYGLTEWDNHAYGTGRSSLVNANLTLGSSSAGTMLFCATPNIFPQGDAGPENSFNATVNLAVEEYVVGWGWVQIWSRNSVQSGVAYGYRYSGFAIHNLRMTIRNVPIPDIIEQDWMWAGAY